MAYSSDPIVLTGCGWVTPLIAGNISTVLESYRVKAASSEIRSKFEPVAREVLDRFVPLPGEAAKEYPVRLAAVALEIALQEAQLKKGDYESHRIGIVLGNALAGLTGMIDFANDVREQSPRFVSPIRFPQTVGNYISGALARGYDIRGPASTIACGSASSVEAILEGFALLKSGQADMVIAGGVEFLTTGIADGLSQDVRHLSDGACLFLLERSGPVKRRGAEILALFPDSPSLQQQDGAHEVVSTAGFHEPNALHIEHWIGQTLGADGAAALAAAIGMVEGHSVPRVRRSEGEATVWELVEGDAQGRELCSISVRSVDPAGTMRTLQVAHS